MNNDKDTQILDIVLKKLDSLQKQSQEHYACDFAEHIIEYIQAERKKKKKAVD